MSTSRQLVSSNTGGAAGVTCLCARHHRTAACSTPALLAPRIDDIWHPTTQPGRHHPSSSWTPHATTQAVT
jgi:hypothetical protein